MTFAGKSTKDMLSDFSKINGLAFLNAFEENDFVSISLRRDRE
jgi:hypothetical protein